MDNWVFKDSTHLLPIQIHPFDTLESNIIRKNNPVKFLQKSSGSQKTCFTNTWFASPYQKPMGCNCVKSYAQSNDKFSMRKTDLKGRE